MKYLFISLAFFNYLFMYAQLNFEANQLMMSYKYFSKSTVADLDQDGNMDILSAYNRGNNSSSNSYHDGGIIWYRNNGVGGFESHIIHEDKMVNTLAVADFDNDGDMDIVVGQLQQSQSTINPDGKVYVLENYGSNFFMEAGTYAKHELSNGAHRNYIIAFDKDSDGDMDIAVANTASVTLHLNQGGMNFNPSGIAFEKPKKIISDGSDILIGGKDGIARWGGGTVKTTLINLTGLQDFFYLENGDILYTTYSGSLLFKNDNGTYPNSNILRMLSAQACDLNNDSITDYFGIGGNNNIINNDHYYCWYEGTDSVINDDFNDSTINYNLWDSINGGVPSYNLNSHCNSPTDYLHFNGSDTAQNYRRFALTKSFSIKDFCEKSRISFYFTYGNSSFNGYCNKPESGNTWNPSEHVNFQCSVDGGPWITRDSLPINDYLGWQKWEKNIWNHSSLSTAGDSVRFRFIQNANVNNNDAHWGIDDFEIDILYQKVHIVDSLLTPYEYSSWGLNADFNNDGTQDIIRYESSWRYNVSGWWDLSNSLSYEGNILYISDSTNGHTDVHFLLRNVDPSLSSILFEDYDMDGDLDIIFEDDNNFKKHTTNNSDTTFKILSIMRNDSNSFGKIDFEGPKCNFGIYRDIKAIDFDNDGDKDFISCGGWLGSGLKKSYIIYWENDGTNKFSGDFIALNDSWGKTALDVGDVDMDGDNDIITYGIDTLTLYRNDSALNFTKILIDSDSLGSFGKEPTIVDLDQDSIPDILASHYGAIYLYQLDSTNQAYTKSLLLNSYNRSKLEVLDFDNDGDLDIIGGDWDIALFENDGNLNFTEVILSTNCKSPYIVNDFDNDGDYDFIAEDPGAADQIKLLINDGNQNFTEYAILTASCNAIASGDADGDGDIDFVFNEGEDGLFFVESLPIITDAEVLESKNNLLVYPNPFTDYIIIDLSLSETESDLFLYNLNGQLVRSHFGISPSRMILLRKNLPSGTYLLKIRSENEQKEEKLIIK